MPASVKEGQGAIRALEEREGSAQGAGRETKRNRRGRQSILMNIPWRSAAITMHPRKSVKFLKIWRSWEAYSRLAEVYPPTGNLPAIARCSAMGYCILSHRAETSHLRGNTSSLVAGSGPRTSGARSPSGAARAARYTMSPSNRASSSSTLAFPSWILLQYTHQRQGLVVQYIVI